MDEKKLARVEYLPAVGRVVPVFYYAADGGLRTCFECLPCEALFSWRDERWECESCEYVLVVPVACEILEEGERVIVAALGSFGVKRPGKEEPQEKQGWFWKIFSRKRRRRLASENS